MLNQDFGDWSAWGKAATAHFAELNNKNRSLIEGVAKENIEMVCSNLASTIKHMQASFKMTEPENFIKAQIEFITDMGSKYVEYSKKMYAMIEGAAKDHCKCCKD